MKEKIIEELHNKLGIIYNDFYNLFEDKQRLNELYTTISKNLINICTYQMDLIENETKSYDNNDGLYRIIPERGDTFYFFAYNKENTDLKHHFQLIKLNKEEINSDINNFLFLHKPVVQIKNTYSHLYDLPDDKRNFLINNYKKQRNITNSKCFLDKDNLSSSLSLEKLSNLNNFILGSHKVSEGIETRFINLLYSLLGGEAFPVNLKSTDKIGFLLNSPASDVEVLFSIFEEYQHEIQKYNQLFLLTSFASHTNKNNVSTKYLEKLEEQIKTVIVENLTPDNLYKINSLFQTNVVSQIYYDNKINDISNIILERFSSEEIDYVIKNVNTSPLIKKIFTRAIFKEKIYKITPISLFTIDQTDLVSWGGSEAHIFSPETLSSLLNALDIKNILDKENGVKYKLNIFLDASIDPQALVSFLRQKLCDIDDKKISSYFKKEDIVPEWHEFRLHAKLKPNDNIQRRKPKI